MHHLDEEQDLDPHLSDADPTFQLGFGSGSGSFLSVFSVVLLQIHFGSGAVRIQNDFFRRRIRSFKVLDPTESGSTTLLKSFHITSLSRVNYCNVLAGNPCCGSGALVRNSVSVSGSVSASGSLSG
jgi:hypothetical protein